MGVETIITLVLGLIDRVAAYAAVLTKARKEGRDVTDAEIDAAIALDAQARDALVAAIANRRANP